MKQRMTLVLTKAVGDAAISHLLDEIGKTTPESPERGALVRTMKRLERKCKKAGFLLYPEECARAAETDPVVE